MLLFCASGIPWREASPDTLPGGAAAGLGAAAGMGAAAAALRGAPKREAETAAEAADRRKQEQARPRVRQELGAGRRTPRGGDG